MRLGLRGRALVLACVGAIGGSGMRAEAAQSCQLGGRYPVWYVAPYTTEVTDFVETTTRRLRGVDLFVPAQPALTQEWLERVVTDQIATGQCDFGVAQAKVSVSSAGGGFTVRVTAADERSAAEIVRRAGQFVK